MAILTTERLVLRHLTLDDAPFIHELTNDPDWIRNIGDRGVRTLEDARAFITAGPHAMHALHGFSLCAVELRDGTTIGMCGLLRRPWLDDADIGFAFLPEYRRAGYAFEAARATLDHARSLGLTRLAAIVSRDNTASRRLLEKLGLTFDRMALVPGETEEVCVYGMVLKIEDVTPFAAGT